MLSGLTRATGPATRFRQRWVSPLLRRILLVNALPLALLVVAIVTPSTISNEIADSNVDRQGYVAFVIDVVATWGLSLGLALLLFFSRPRADDKGARS